MSDSTFPLPERAQAPAPWWKRRWRRLPFWAWAGIVLTGVGVVGAQVGGEGSGGGAAVADLTPMSAPAVSAADTSAPAVQSSTTVVVTAAIPSSSTASPPPPTDVPTVIPTVIPTLAPTTVVAVVPIATVPVDSVWTVTSVTDGDTIDVDGPNGGLTVRLIGINTPERDECWADQATAALSALVAGQAVTLVRDSSDADQYGRALRYVETVGGVDVGAALVESGDAISRRYEPDTARSDRYDALQGQASDAGLGQWASDACGAAVPSVSISVEVRADAAGDDNDNLNDEWVRFTNAGITAADLDGWVVADESTSHRYVLADLVLDPGRSVTLYTGCGSDSPDSRYWCNTGSAVWNNSGDTVFLRDPSGNNVVVHRY